MNFQALLAEFFGTMFYCFFFTFATDGVNLPFVAIGLGFYIYVMSSAIGDLSGAHYNPAITLTMLISRNCKPGAAGFVEAFLYILMQFLGGLLAMGFQIGFRGHDAFRSNLLLELNGGTSDFSKAVTSRRDSTHPDYGRYHDRLPEGGRRLFADKADELNGLLESNRSGDFFIEMFAATLFLYVLLNVGTPDKNPSSPLAYSVAWTASAIGVYYNGGAVSLNPMRALVTAMFETAAYNPAEQVNSDDSYWETQSWWSRQEGGRSFYVWIMGPFTAAVLAPFIYYLVRGTCKVGARSNGKSLGEVKA